MPTAGRPRPRRAIRARTPTPQGFHQWEAGQYDQAISTLKAFTAAYPKHRRVSYANNLIGRSLLDKGDARDAAAALLANYRSNPGGERAPDSLYYLGQATMKLGQPAQACKAYDEFDAIYGAKVRARPQEAGERRQGSGAVQLSLGIARSAATRQSVRDVRFARKTEASLDIDSLLDRFRGDLDALLAPRARIGVAVSGGPDSLALLLLAAAARPGQVEAATIDHGLRAEARDEAEMVAESVRGSECPTQS